MNDKILRKILIDCIKTTINFIPEIRINMLPRQNKFNPMLYFNLIKYRKQISSKFINYGYIDRSSDE